MWKNVWKEGKGKKGQRKEVVGKQTNEQTNKTNRQTDRTTEQNKTKQT